MTNQITVGQAGIRALRTGLQSLVGTLIGLTGIEALSQIEILGENILVALIASALAAAVSFLQNVAENVLPVDIPKG